MNGRSAPPLIFTANRKISPNSPLTNEQPNNEPDKWTTWVREGRDGGVEEAKFGGSALKEERREVIHSHQVDTVKPRNNEFWEDEVAG